MIGRVSNEIIKIIFVITCLFIILLIYSQFYAVFNFKGSVNEKSGISLDIPKTPIPFSIAVTCNQTSCRPPNCFCAGPDIPCTLN